VRAQEKTPASRHFVSAMEHSSIVGVLRLVRFSMGLLVVGTFIAMSVLFDGAINPGDALLAISLFLLTCFGFAFNDVFDREYDKRYKPHRPLPSGAVSMSGAVSIVLLTGSAGLALSWLVGAEFGTLSVAIIMCTASYSFLKRTTLFPTLFLTPLLCSAPFLFSWVYSQEPSSLILAGLMSVFLFGREQLKDLQDVKGDSEAGLRTIPSVFGVRLGTVAMAGSFFLLLLLLPIPHFAVGGRVFGPIYCAVTVPCVGLTGMTAALLALRSRSPQSLHLALVVSKYGLVAGIAGLAFQGL